LGSLKEAEGKDRLSLLLPGTQRGLLDNVTEVVAAAAAAKAGSSFNGTTANSVAVIVVIISGSAVDLSALKSNPVHTVLDRTAGRVGHRLLLFLVRRIINIIICFHAYTLILFGFCFAFVVFFGTTTIGRARDHLGWLPRAGGRDGTWRRPLRHAHARRHHPI
jgi:hypothetical protein